MHRIQTKKQAKSTLAAMAGFLLALAPLGSAMAAPLERNPSLDAAVMETVLQCQRISASCATMTKDAVGVLVFPSVIKADLIIGGAGGKGALIEKGRITEYYSIGAASAGLQAGIESSSQVFAFRTPAALAELKRSPDWKLGAKAGVTLVSADANAGGVADQNVFAYVFDGQGLHAGLSLDAFDIWKTGQRRP